MKSSDDETIEEPLINLMPLIDVVLVVLITFILVAPMLDIDQIELAPGGQKETTTSPNTALSITVRSDNTIWMRGREITLAQLGDELRREKATHPNQTPQVIHDRRAQFGTYQNIKNTLESAGFEQMDLLLQP